ncbi:Na(+) H(+) exchange regulatory cofactor NHE-RF3 [Labeo rohita]|uniref:Na(+) H(+) exchange regulatory cofactor NHE-RF3 n=1 Tax=Labeo rohita TaxID=84645 RepID=A0A498LY27_LABRO|nr:Na(+) H(+) exchange regulatory cofactor NHE-RF3 [Labeo rohita]
MAGPKPRVITLSKRDGQGYGFFLRVEHGEEGHLIRDLEMRGVAEMAGLKDGDRIIRVNGTFVDNKEHNQVADLVKKSGMTVTLHILGEEAYKSAKAKGVNLADPQLGQSHPTMNGVSAPATKAKLCYLQKSSSGFGFSLKSTKDSRGIFMTEVLSGGVADKAGVKTGDRIVEINSENVESLSHDQTVQKIKAAGDKVMFLLVDEDTDKFFRSKGIRPSVAHATVKHLQHKPRIADMTKKPDGYGFMLREDPKHPGHYLGEIDKGSPAEQAGLKSKDRLAAVNGQEVDHCRHEQVVEKISQQGNKCSLLVLDPETDKMYKLGDVSPLLYWEEMRGAPPGYPEHEAEAIPALAVPAPADLEHKPRLCRLEKTAAGFGFHLNGIQGTYGQYIKEVVKGGAADKAGLKDDDIVVEVNGVNVEKIMHEEVVDLIRKSGNTLFLLVADRTAYEYLKARGIPISLQLINNEPSTDDPAPAYAEEDEKKDTESDNERPATPPAQTRSRVHSVVLLQVLAPM